MSDRLKAKDNFFKVGFIGSGTKVESWNRAFDTVMTETMIVDEKDLQLIVDWGPNMLMICDCEDPIRMSAIIEPVINGLVLFNMTLDPDTADKVVSAGRKVVYFPEMSPAPHRSEDIHFPSLLVAGGYAESLEQFEQLLFMFSKILPTKMYKLSGTEAAFVKLGIDSFLATKTIFFNQLFDIVKEVGGNPLTITRCVGSDHRINMHSTMVPETDGRPGYSLDKQQSVELLKDFVYNLECDNFTLLDEVKNVNDKLRGE